MFEVVLFQECYLFDDLLGVFEEFDIIGGECYIVSGVDQQFVFYFVFEIFYCCGQGGLGDVEQVGGGID